MNAAYPPRYIHEVPDWPRFRWDIGSLAAPLAEVRHRQGLLTGRLEALGFDRSMGVVLEALADEVQRSGEIEGERLERDQVRSSIARRLGIEIGGLVPADRRVEGMVEMMLDATQQFGAPLTAERLFGWHAALFPTAWSGLRRIAVGRWRDDSGGPMRVVSGPIGRERVHYEAPAAHRVDSEMRRFVEWFNGETTIDPVLKAALAHLWFVTIHPFDDGNGRIGRAGADVALARAERSGRRFYSMSAQICRERADYYAILEQTQKGGMDVTPWMRWFVECLGRAIEGAELSVSEALERARFWDRIEQGRLNDRQRKMLNRLLDGFEGKLTTAKWAKIAKCSHDTALRDVQDLIARGVLIREEAGGRSTSYSLRRG